MQALQLTEPKNWNMIDIDTPPPPGPDEALVRVHRVGICGTDVGGYLGKMPFFSYPRIPGHELGVEILQVGSAVKNLKVGDRCAVEPYLNCQKCYSCLRGFTNCCENLKTLGVMCDGGLTDQMLLPARKLHPAPGLTDDQCALVETLAIGYHAVERARMLAGETMLILGAGPIGLSVLEFARIFGARVIMGDLISQRLQFVRDKLKVQETLQITGTPADIEKLKILTEDRLADIVIDATGHAGSMVRAMEFASFAGRIVYVGITQNDLTFQHAPLLHRRELSILASRNAPSRAFAHIIQLITCGAIDTTPWITHHLKFSDVPQKFAEVTDPAGGVIKAIITMP
jgi:alcohol dehydrogenase